MNRRMVLTAAPAAMLAGSSATASGSPILDLFQRRRRLVDDAEVYALTNPTCTDADIDRLFFDEVYRIEEQMMELPCQTPGDFVAKIIARTARGGVSEDWDEGPIWQEARRLVSWDARNQIKRSVDILSARGLWSLNHTGPP